MRKTLGSESPEPRSVRGGSLPPNLETDTPDSIPDSVRTCPPNYYQGGASFDATSDRSTPGPSAPPADADFSQYDFNYDSSPPNQHDDTLTDQMGARHSSASPTGSISAERVSVLLENQKREILAGQNAGQAAILSAIKDLDAKVEKSHKENRSQVDKLHNCLYKTVVALATTAKPKLLTGVTMEAIHDAFVTLQETNYPDLTDRNVVEPTHFDITKPIATYMQLYWICKFPERLDYLDSLLRRKKIVTSASSASRQMLNRIFTQHYLCHLYWPNRLSGQRNFFETVPLNFAKWFIRHTREAVERLNIQTPLVDENGLPVNDEDGDVILIDKVVTDKDLYKQITIHLNNCRSHKPKSFTPHMPIVEPIHTLAGRDPGLYPELPSEEEVDRENTDYESSGQVPEEVNTEETANARKKRAPKSAKEKATKTTKKQGKAKKVKNTKKSFTSSSDSDSSAEDEQITIDGASAISKRQRLTASKSPTTSSARRGSSSKGQGSARKARQVIQYMDTTSSETETETNQFKISKRTPKSKFPIGLKRKFRKLRKD